MSANCVSPGSLNVLRKQAHDELDKCLDEARSGSLGWLNDYESQFETDRVYRHVHGYAVACAKLAADARPGTPDHLCSGCEPCENCGKRACRSECLRPSGVEP